MRMCCPYCHRIGGHNVGCPEYEPEYSHHTCCECDEKIAIGEEYIKNDEGEYMHYDCIPSDEKLINWLGFRVQEMEEEYE